MQNGLKKTLNVLASLYFFMMAAVFPLFVRNGYNRIGSIKFYFFRDAGILLLMMLPMSLLYGMLYVRKKWSISVTDLFVFFYGVVVCLSGLSSEFGSDNYYSSALWGSKGWYMGLVTQILLILCYFMISRFFTMQERGIQMILCVSSLIFLLGIFNRFGWYPIPMEGAERGFISTLGNINWYCGYFSVVFPLGYGLFLTAGTKRTRLLCGVYLLLGFAAGMTQGSDSGFLVMAALFAAGFWFGCRDIRRMRYFLETGILFCISSQLLHGARLLFPGRFNYDTAVIDQLTDTGWTFLSLLIFLCLYAFAVYVEKKRSVSKIVWKSMQLTEICLAGMLWMGYLLLVYFNTRHPLLVPALNGNPVFTFNSEYMNGRGTAWHAGIAMFLEFPLWHRLVGIGPDCFAAYAYTKYQGVWELEEQFGNLVLTNAHNEWITLLVNVGVWGLATFVGAFASIIGRAFRRAGENPYLPAAGLSLFCYLLHNMVSFGQVINTSTVFLVMGVAEGFLRLRTDEVK